MEILEENEFLRLEDRGEWIVLVDKTLLGLPIVRQGETTSVLNIVMDFVEVGGKQSAVNTYYPKADVELKLIRQTFYTLTKKYEKDKQALSERFGRG